MDWPSSWARTTTRATPASRRPPSWVTCSTPLPERERTILRLRFEQELTQREIGKRIGMSQMQVSRLIRRSIAALHASATQPSGPDGAAKSATGRGMNDDDKPVPEVRDADRSRVPPAG